MSNVELLGGFREELSTVRGLADNTVSIYIQEVSKLLEFCSSRKIRVKSATRADLIAWRQSMNDRADAGVALAVTAVRTFFAYLDLSDRFPDFRVAVKDQEPTDVPTVGQFLEMREQLKREITDPRCVPSVTRQALFETLAGSTLRISALLSLRKKHLHLDDAKPYIMIVRGEVECKGKHAGAVPLSPYAAMILRRHVVHSCLQDEDLVFDLSQSVVRKILDAVSPAGLHLSPHSLRHYGCSMLYFKNYDGGRNDVVWVRDAAGHANISTTDGYLKLARRVVQSEEQWEIWANGGKS